MTSAQVFARDSKSYNYVLAVRSYL